MQSLKYPMYVHVMISLSDIFIHIIPAFSFCIPIIAKFMHKDENRTNCCKKIWDQGTTEAVVRGENH